MQAQHFLKMVASEAQCILKTIIIGLCLRPKDRLVSVLHRTRKRTILNAYSQRTPNNVKLSSSKSVGLCVVKRRRL